MLISAFGLHPCGADLRSVCAAERRSSSLSEFQAAFGRWRMGRDWSPEATCLMARTAFFIPVGVSSCLRQMADGEGFEPSVHCCTHAFQACAFDHSATHPEKNALINTGRRRAASRGEISFLGRPRRPASAREGDGLPGSGAMGIRTPDLLNAIEALYQLSYDP